MRHRAMHEAPWGNRSIYFVDLVITVPLIRTSAERGTDRTEVTRKFVGVVAEFPQSLQLLFECMLSMRARSLEGGYDVQDHEAYIRNRTLFRIQTCRVVAFGVATGVI